MKKTDSVTLMAQFRKAALRNKSHELDKATRLVLVDLLEHYNHTTGQCNPSYRTIAKNIRVSIRTVARAIQQLKRTGWINVTQRFNNSVFYSFDWWAPVNEAAAESAMEDALQTEDNYDYLSPLTRPDTTDITPKTPVTRHDTTDMSNATAPKTPVTCHDATDMSYSQHCHGVVTPVTGGSDTSGVLTNESTKEITKERTNTAEKYNSKDEWKRNYSQNHPSIVHSDSSDPDDDEDYFRDLK